MTKKIRIVVGDKEDTVVVNSVEEIKEYNKKYSICPIASTVYYGEPFNTEIILNGDTRLNTVFPTLYLTNAYNITYLAPNNLSSTREREFIFSAIQLQFELEREGIEKNFFISRGVSSSDSMSIDSHPLGYITRSSMIDVRKAVVLLGLLKLKREDLVDKYKNLLENNYCTIKETKELVGLLEEINGILA